MPSIAAAKSKKMKSSGDFIHELKVKPQDHLRVFLGGFDIAKKFKGFAIEVRPKTTPDNAVYTRITKLETDLNTKFFLDITNKGVRSVTARVQQV